MLANKKKKKTGLLLLVFAFPFPQAVIDIKKQLELIVMKLPIFVRYQQTTFMILSYQARGLHGSKFSGLDERYLGHPIHSQQSLARPFFFFSSWPDQLKHQQNKAWSISIFTKLLISLNRHLQLKIILKKYRGIISKLTWKRAEGRGEKFSLRGTKIYSILLGTAENQLIQN